MLYYKCPGCGCRIPEAEHLINKEGHKCPACGNVPANEFQLIAAPARRIKIDTMKRWTQYICFIEEYRGKELLIRYSFIGTPSAAKMEATRNRRYYRSTLYVIIEAQQKDKACQKARKFMSKVPGKWQECNILNK